MITEVTRYVTLGREFKSMEHAELFRYDRIGELMDAAMPAWGPGAKLRLIDYMVENRDKLRELLNY